MLDKPEEYLQYEYMKDVCVETLLWNIRSNSEKYLQ